ncbi:uncharacterized protein LOC113278940 [Papaver somniferum]|uniref:uncharacterized protein LOC113278940 n=1 Tax=Papaver somniferum TaxID=3469 RepID=UPI000E6F6C1B|nr:uncharacterized protein LOC113278940 [Papaver somniferum]
MKIYVKALPAPAPKSTHVALTKVAAASEKGESSGTVKRSELKAEVSPASKPYVVSVSLHHVGALRSLGSTSIPVVSSGFPHLPTVSSLTIKESASSYVNENVTPSTNLLAMPPAISAPVESGFHFDPASLAYVRKGKRSRTSFESVFLGNSSCSFYSFMVPDKHETSITYARNLKKIINVFAKASGQAINFKKSGFIDNGKMHHKHIKLMSRTLKIKFLSNYEKYLGTPLFIGRDKSKSFYFLVENFYSRLRSCKKTNLKVAGRTVVTKHVLSSLAVYHMSCFPLPKKITSKIDTIQRTFWWSKKNLKHAAYFCSSGDIGKSKLYGGLRIRNTYATNRVFICKLGWRVISNPNNLVSIFLKDKYFPNQNLLEIDKAADSSSWIWKGIVIGLNFTRDNVVTKINDSASNKIRSFNWISSSFSPPVSSHRNYCNYTVVSDLIDVQNNCWNVSLLYDLFSPGEVIRIRTIRINLNKSDRLMWAHTKNGAFTIKSAYRSYMNENSALEDANFWRKVWCPLCHDHEETVVHLFIKGPVVTHIWFGVSFEHLINTDLEWIDDIFMFWHDIGLSLSPFNVNWPSIGAIVMWCIWKLRCDVSFRNTTIDINKAVMETKKMINTYIARPLMIRRVNKDIKVPKSEVEHFMFIDGSFKDYDMGLGVIWCDIAGRIRIIRADFGLISDAVGAETAALILAISWAKKMNLFKIIIVSDCVQLMDFVNGGSTNIDWRSSDLLED